MAPASHSDTAARLDALADYGILDTEAEQGFDDIVLLASQLCETPVALVSLVAEDRQWFKARIGFEPCETPIGQSVCAHALDRTDPLVIPDLTEDPRTKDNTLVTGEPFIRFYAGAPLVTPAGIVVGTLCVIDRLPRPQGLQPNQMVALQALARQVVAQLELRKLYREENVRLRHEGTRARLAQEAGGIGTFELDVTTHELTVSAEFCRLFGLPVAANYPARTIEALIVQEDGAVRSTSRSRRDGSAPLDVEYRIHRADDGRLRWIARSGKFLRDDDGHVRKMFGTVQDVTNRRRLQIYQNALLELGDRLRAAENTESVASVASDVLGRTLAVSRAGYARIDMRDATMDVEKDWTAPGVATLAGRHPLAAFKDTIDHLAMNQTMAVGNIEDTDWLAGDWKTYRDIDTRAEIKVPLVVKGELVGVLYAHQRDMRVWSRDEVDFALGVADRTYSALARLQAETEQQVLNAEIAHRLKNTLALVQAVVAQTLRHVPERGPVEALEKRIHALAAAHDVLFEQSSMAAPMRAVIHSVLQAFDAGDRVVIEGPDLTVGSRVTLSLSLLIHELATNAAKYGALSTETGHVTVSWRVKDGTLTLTWTERGGPPAEAPARSGFGSRLIRMGLVGTGSVNLRYTQSGFEADMTAPLAQVGKS